MRYRATQILCHSYLLPWRVNKCTKQHVLQLNIAFSRLFSDVAIGYFYNFRYFLLTLTFNRYMDRLVDWHLGLDQNATQVGPFVGALLHVRKPQGAILKHHLTMIIRQLHAVLQPLDRVVRVANHAACYICVSACHRCDISHGSYSRRTWRHGEEREGMEGGHRDRRESRRTGRMRWRRS